MIAEYSDRGGRGRAVVRHAAEFDGLAGFRAPADARHCYSALRQRATVVSPAPRLQLERIREHVLAHIPRSDELITLPQPAAGEAAAASPA